MRSLLLILFGLGCLLLRTGFALQASGSLRAKNASGAILRITADAAAAALAFWAVGAAILFQNYNGWLGIDRHLLFAQPPERAGETFFHLTLCLIGGAVAAGALAERARFYVGVGASAVLGGLVFPIAGHLVWFGKLRDWNFIDLGGASVIHLSAAVFGAIGVAVVGARAGKYNKDGSSTSIPGHALPMLGIGAMVLFVSWFPYLLGCLAAHWPWEVTPLSELAFGIAATNILLAGMAGVAGGLLYSQFRYGKPDMFFAYGGLLGALVAISPDMVDITSFAAVMIGLVAGVIVPMVWLMVDLDAHLDDPIGLISIHGVGAIWGVLAIAFFRPTTAFSDHFRLLAIQSGGLLVVIVISAVTAAVLFLGLKMLGPLRVVEADEFDGLDIGEHDINSYPDFQQTTIKSYHLREA
jgi:Amt family ammonium transporter